MSQADLTKPSPVELLVRSPVDRLEVTSPDDGPLVTAATELVADVVLVAVIQALDDEDVGRLEIRTGLRYGISERIRVLRHGWGSWEAIFAVPPDTVVWAIHEIGWAIAADLIVSVGQRALERLRSGDVDRDLVERELVEREFTFDLHFPNGKPLLGIKRKSRRTVYRKQQVTPAKTKSAPAPNVQQHGRKGRKPKRK